MFDGVCLAVNTSPTVSIVIPAHDDASTISKCLAAILSGTFQNLEVVVVDDQSRDATWSDLLAYVAHPQIRLIRNANRRGAAHSRNRGVAAARGEFVFFLDADCIPEPDWVEMGLTGFTSPAVIAVEGAVFYGNDSPSLRDKVPINPLYNLSQVRPVNLPQCDYAAGNIAYRASVLRAENGFDAATFAVGREDTDLALRALRHGKIVYRREMKVVHVPSRWTVAALLRNAGRYECDVHLYQRHGIFAHRWGRVLHPKFFIMLLIPPFFLGWALRYVRSRADFFFLGPLYLYLLALRFHIWRAAWRGGLFVI
jgi:glycosyltransferase involved in cell wall biosynthesis